MSSKKYIITDKQFNELKEYLEKYENLKEMTYFICDEMLNAPDDDFCGDYKYLFSIDTEDYDHSLRNFKFLIDDIEVANN